MLDKLWVTWSSHEMCYAAGKQKYCFVTIKEAYRPFLNSFSSSGGEDRLIFNSGCRTEVSAPLTIPSVITLSFKLLNIKLPTTPLFMIIVNKFMLLLILIYFIIKNEQHQLFHSVLFASEPVHIKSVECEYGCWKVSLEYRKAHTV